MLVLLRHGQSEWNLSNRFTGWADVPLTEQGRKDARYAGQLLCDAGFKVDTIYASGLERSTETAEIVRDLLQERHPARRPIRFLQRHRLNERHYGALTGLSKREALATMGPELTAWRSTFDGRPPPLDSSSPCYAAIAALEGAARVEGLAGVPLTESIRDCCRRVEPIWRREIRPAVLRRGKVVLVVGHANCLRALIKCVQGLSDEEMRSLGVPNGLPLVYEFTSSGEPLPNALGARGTIPPLQANYLGAEAPWFEELDRDSSGTLTAEELAQGGLCDPDEPGACEALEASMDNNGSGDIDFNEFFAWLNKGTD